MIDVHWYDLVGLAGTLMILIAFFMQQIGRLPGTALAYAAWVLVSAYGIARTLKQRRISNTQIP